MSLCPPLYERKREKDWEKEGVSPCGTLINGQMARPLSQLFLSVSVCVNSRGVQLICLNILTQWRVLYISWIDTDSHAHMLISNNREEKGRNRNAQALLYMCVCFFSVCVSVCVSTQFFVCVPIKAPTRTRACGTLCSSLMMSSIIVCVHWSIYLLL